MSRRDMGVMGAAASSLSLLRLFSIVLLLLCSVFSTGAAAQGGKPPGLGAVLAGEKNLTTFYNLIQVSQHGEQSESGRYRGKGCVFVSVH